MYPILISLLEEPPRNNINQNQWGDNYKKFDESIIKYYTNCIKNNNQSVKTVECERLMNDIINIKNK